ncbi:hypothetical protein HYX13_04195 [Candidatus Woesearchaeota archaeon]|nr:hypothetical protein [Candidatus Woesearchaeota archaeon]
MTEEKDSKKLAEQLARDAAERDENVRRNATGSNSGDATFITHVEQGKREAGESLRTTGIPEPEGYDSHKGQVIGMPEKRKTRKGFFVALGLAALLGGIEYCHNRYDKEIAAFNVGISEKISRWSNGIESRMREGYDEEYKTEDKKEVREAVQTRRAEAEAESGLRTLEPLQGTVPYSPGHFSELPDSSALLGTIGTAEADAVIADGQPTAIYDVQGKPNVSTSPSLTTPKSKDSDKALQLPISTPTSKVTAQGVEKLEKGETPMQESETSRKNLDSLLVDHDDNPETPKITLRALIDEYQRLRDLRGQMLGGIIDSNLRKRTDNDGTLPLYFYVEAAVKSQSSTTLAAIFTYILRTQAPDMQMMTTASYEDACRLVVGGYETDLRQLGVSKKDFGNTIYGDSEAGLKGCGKLLAAAYGLSYPVPMGFALELQLLRETSEKREVQEKGGK